MFVSLGGGISRYLPANLIDLVVIRQFVDEPRLMHNNFSLDQLFEDGRNHFKLDGNSPILIPQNPPLYTLLIV